MILKQSSKITNEVILFLKKGGVVVCSTDTVYGFLADASNKKAVEKIYKIKKRPKSKPLPIFVKDIKMAKELAFINEKQAKVLQKFWPGKYTFVLNRKLDTKLYGVSKNTIAVRIPKYNFLNNLLKKINQPLSQTSVNFSGKVSLSSISDIIKQFNKQNILIVNAGDIKKGKPSKIIDLTKNKIINVRK